MAFFQRSVLNRVFARLTIVALVSVFMVAAPIGGRAIHAASGTTATTGKVSLAGTGNLQNAPAASSNSVRILKPPFAVNRLGVNGHSGSNPGQAPVVDATVSQPAAAAGHLLQSFDGVSDKDNAITTGFILTPPDQGLCVGPLASFHQKVVFEPVNIAFRIFSTSGKSIFGPAPLSFLFNEPAFPKEFISDPSCAFDPGTKDFFFTVLAFNLNGTESHLDITVLHQDGGFVTYRFDETDKSGRGCPCFGDQPLLGFDQYNIYVSSNEFPLKQPSPFYNGAQVFAISKSQLAAFSQVVNFAEFAHLSDSGILIETLQPAVTYDNAAPAEYLVNSMTVDAYGYNNNADHRLGIFAITNRGAVTQGGTPTLSNPTVINSEPYVQPNIAPQPSHQLLLNADDDRMKQVEYARGSLMATLSTAVFIKGDNTRDGAAWFDLNTSMQGSLTVNASINHQGYIAAKGLYVLYPAILKNSSGTVEMAFSITNGTINPSAAYTIVPDGSSPPGAGVISVAGTGNGSYSDTFTCSRTSAPFACRWGDYSWITLDEGSNNFWMGSEYVPPASDSVGNANWGTRVYEVSG
ncbi:MAG: hypothetical protein ACR2JC_05635 [Chloroflexota bacterium]